MKKIKKYSNKIIIITLCALIAISSLWVGGVYAYFSAKASATGSVTTGHIYITGISGSSGNQLFYNIDKVVPNQAIQEPVEVEVTTNIDYYTRVSFSLEVTNTGTHAQNCGDNIEDPIADIEVMSSNYTSYTDNGTTYWYKLDPTEYDPSGITVENFDLRLYIESWVGDGGCSYYMNANIKVNIVVEVVQANFLESQNEGGSYTESNVSTLHGLFVLALGQNSDTNEESDYEIIEFGMFPQSLKKDNVTVSATAGTDGYFTGSDGAKYYEYTTNFQLGDYYEDENSLTYEMNVTDDGRTMNHNTTYYFKLEPIKWRVLKEENGTKYLVCNNVLQAMAFQPHYQSGDDGELYASDGEGNFLLDENGNKFYANDYKNSNLRQWFNGEFLSTAFTAEEQNKIQLVEVDNSASTTDSASNPYACANTTDKVYALSYQDMINPEYKFNTNYQFLDINRLFKTTDFARATGAWTFTYKLALALFKEYGVTDKASFINLIMSVYGITEEDANKLYDSVLYSGDSWLRSPIALENYSTSRAVWHSDFGSLGVLEVSDVRHGVLPAIQIKL